MAKLDLGSLLIGIVVNNAAANKALKDTQKVSKETANSMTVDWQQVGTKLSSIGSKMTMALTLPLVALGTASVKLASDMEETKNKINAVFGDSANSITSWADNSIEKMGLAKQTALDMAAVFGDMGTGMGMTTAEAGKMSTELVQLAADLASFKNISIERAQTALTGVYTGETEALKGLGVVMTEANLEQFAVNQGLKTTYKEMTQAEKVALRYKYVMNATANAQGDFARTGDGLANQSRMLKENLKELGVQFGEVLLPVVNKIITGLNELLKSFGELSVEQREVIVIIGLIVAAIGPAVSIVGNLITAINGVKTAITALNTAMTATSGIVGVIIIAITALIALFASLSAEQKKYEEAAREKLHKSIDETNAKYAEMAEKTIEAKNKTGDLTEKLNELSETDPNVKINTNAEIVQPQIEELRTAIGNLLLGSVDLKEGVDDLNGSLDDYVNALVEARKATTIDHIMNMVDAYHQGLISQEQFNQYVNESVAGFNNYKAVIGEAKDGFDGFIASLNNGGKISLETTNSLLNGGSGLAEQGVSLGTQLNNAAEGMANLTQASQEGTIATGGYNVEAQKTAGLLAGEMTNAVNTITDAYDNYQIRVQTAYDAEKENIKEAEAYKAALEEKAKAFDIFTANIYNKTPAIIALKNIEESYGKETAQLIKDSLKEKYGTFEITYDDCLKLASEWSSEIKQCEADLNKESGKIAEDRKNAILKAEEQLAADINATTTGWTNQQIDDFVKLAKKSGLVLDEGFVNMLKSCNRFVEDSQSSFNQAGEFSAEAFKKGLDKLLPKLDEFKTDTNGKGKAIGTNLSDGIAIGIRNNEYKAINEARRVVEKAIAAAKKAGDIHSPSRKMASEIGKPLAQGVGVGFEDELPKTLNKVRKGIGNITVGISTNDATAANRVRTQSNNNLINAIKSLKSGSITQNNTFTSKELTPYEQQIQVKKLSRDLAGVFA